MNASDRRKRTGSVSQKDAKSRQFGDELSLQRSSLLLNFMIYYPLPVLNPLQKALLSKMIFVPSFEKRVSLCIQPSQCLPNSIQLSREWVWSLFGHQIVHQSCAGGTIRRRPSRLPPSKPTRPRPRVPNQQGAIFGVTQRGFKFSAIETQCGIWEPRQAWAY